jgi:hypothetical protein
VLVLVLVLVMVLLLVVLWQFHAYYHSIRCRREFVTDCSLLFRNVVDHIVLDFKLGDTTVRMNKNCSARPSSFPALPSVSKACSSLL